MTATNLTSEGFGRTNVHLSDGFRDVKDDLCDGFARTNLHLSEGFRDGIVKTVEVGNSIERNDDRHFADLRYEGSKQYGELKFQIERTAAQAAKEAAECCCETKMLIQDTQHQISMQTCEIKEKIGVDGEMTRELIKNLNIQSLTAQLSDAKAQIGNAGLIQQVAALLNGTGNGNGNGN